MLDRMLDLEGIGKPCGGLLLRRLHYVALLAMASLALGGCPKGNTEVADGRKAEAIQDYDTALVHYERALRADPTNAEYKLRAQQARYDAGQFHVHQGQKAVKAGDLQLGLAEFQKAQLIDPSNVAADQEVKRTMDLILAQSAPSQHGENVGPAQDDQVLSGPPELKPLSREPINLKMTNDARVVYETIAKLAGLSVIFDPDFTSRRITADLPNVTLEQALDDVSLESKAFWKPVSASVIFVAPDQPQKRKDVEDEEVKTFYLANTLTPQDLTEVVNGLRQLLDLHRLQQVNAQNAIVIRDTPDKLALAAKIIADIDRAKPEVLVHVQVLTASVNRLRDLGILPGQSISVAFSPRAAFQPGSTSTTSTTSTTTTTTTTSTTSTTSTPQITLNYLKKIGWQDFAITLPGAQANAILTDDRTRIIQDPELRVTDGQKATLKIGERVPVATGSFQAGVGVGVTGSSGVVNPLVNTQFQYIDVGVNIEVTPRVHPDGEVSMKLVVEVSSITGTSNIGGISQPVISQRKIEHDIRLKEGEVSVLGGLIERTDTKNINGIPGIGEVPLMRYLFSDNQVSYQEDETLIVLTPHILRLPSLSEENLKPMAAGTDSNVRVYREDATVETPAAVPQPAVAAAPRATLPAALPAIEPTSLSQSSVPTGATPAPAQTGPTTVQLHFEPAVTHMRTGDTETLGLAISNVNDLYSIPLMIHYDPAVIRVEEVRNGGFLSGGTQEIAIVQRIDQQKGEVIVSATRQPNTPGVNGTGTVLGFVVHAVGPGTSHLEILQVNAHNSQQQPIPIVSGEATIQVQ
jgi:general secretion pathway protein D